MKFFLVKEKHVVFTDIPSKTKSESFAKKEVSVPVDLQLDEKNTNEESKSFVNLLKSVIYIDPPKKLARKCSPSKEREKQPFAMEKDKLGSNLHVQIGIYLHEKLRSFVRVADDANGNILENIRAAMEKYKIGWKIGFKMEKYTSTGDNGIVHKHEGYAFGMDYLAQISSNKIGSEGAELSYLSPAIGVYWSIPDMQKNHNAVISIFCEVDDANPLPAFAIQHACHISKMNQRILAEEIMSDAIIRTKDNAEIKCHSVFLAVQSDVLEKAFGGSFEESKTKIIEMPDMSSVGIKAFLAFLYYGDLEKATEKSATAVEVLQASHKYNVANLEDPIRAILLTKPDEWFDVETALKLFLFSRLLEEEEKLKFRAVQLIEANFATFESSPMYDELFKENPEAAKELFKVVCMQ